MTAYDPEMMEYFRAILGDDLANASSPEEQEQLYGRKLKQTIALNDLNRNAASLQVPGYTAPDGVGSSMLQRDDGQVSFNAQSPEETAAVYELEDASPFRSSGFIGAGPDQGYGEQTLSAFGDAVMRDYSPAASDPYDDPYNMQLEEPDDEETQKRKAALLSMGGM